MFSPRMAATVLGIVALLASVNCLSIAAAGAPKVPETYAEARDFLAGHTKLLELTDKHGGAVLICPEYQGRVMTSTCGGPDGKSFGWINQSFIEKGSKDAHFNNYGGEERFWLGPEGGQFSLWFAPGAKQNLENWLTPPALNEGAFHVASSDEQSACHLTRRMQLQNASKTRFDLEVKRDVRLLGADAFGKLFGGDARRALEAGAMQMIGYETANTITNRGAPMTKEKGLVAIWSLGQVPPGRLTKIFVPYKPGDKAKLGPAVKSDYFGIVGPPHLQVYASCITFLGDGEYRAKIGISQRRGKSVAGSIDADAGVLTLVHFTLPDDPTQDPYVNNAWDLPQREPYVGDVFNSYNDGPPAPGKPSLGGFYELESLSPAAELPTGKSLTHVKSTFHIQGDLAALAKVLEAALDMKTP